MNTQGPIDTARTLVVGDKGLLPMDESNPTCNKRFAKLGIPQTEGARRAWRELIVSTPGVCESISGAILYDEMIRQQKDGTPFLKVLTNAGVIPGIKVDTGAKGHVRSSWEKISEGLDGLRDRLGEYAQMGVRFAKWRAVITVGEGIPSPGCIEANAQALARYGALCQEAGLVPARRGEYDGPRWMGCEYDNKRAHALAPIPHPAWRDRVDDLRAAHRPHGHSADRARRGRGAGACAAYPGHPFCPCVDQSPSARAADL